MALRFILEQPCGQLSPIPGMRNTANAAQILRDDGRGLGSELLAELKNIAESPANPNGSIKEFCVSKIFT
jgi:aryl-alcohol dehydrogenase-like predicted oxidoreductase